MHVRSHIYGQSEQGSLCRNCLHGPASCLIFLPVFYAFRTPFQRVFDKSFSYPADRPLEPLKTAGVYPSKCVGYFSNFTKVCNKSNSFLIASSFVAIAIIIVMTIDIIATITANIDTYRALFCVEKLFFVLI